MTTSRLLAAIGSALIAVHAHAGLIGDTVNASQSTPFGSTLSLNKASETVSASGPEFILNIGINTGVIGGRGINIDVQDTFITFTYNNNAIGTGFSLCNNDCLLTISNIDDIITGVSVSQTDVGGLRGLGPNTASFTAHSITLSFDGTWDATDTVRIDITSRRANVPEPGSLALLGLGLAGLGALRRKRS